jgi:hypothetical protein
MAPQRDVAEHARPLIALVCGMLFVARLLTARVLYCRVQAQIADLFTAAFKDPIASSKMIGFRFTVGGGKKVRQKYGDDMPKYCR